LLHCSARRVFCAASDGFVRQALADVSSTAGFRQAAGTRGIKPRSDSSEESAILTVWVSSLSAMGPRLFLSARMTKPATLPQARWRIDILGLEDKHLGTVEAPAATRTTPRPGDGVGEVDGDGAAPDGVGAEAVAGADRLLPAWSAARS
jgi:hypothetical protein